MYHKRSTTQRSNNDEESEIIMQTKHLYIVDVTVQQRGRTGHTITRHYVYATTLGRAEAHAKRAALRGLTDDHYAYAYLSLSQELTI